VGTDLESRPRRGRQECLSPPKISGGDELLMIRLARTGATKKPHYRVVVIDKARARDGRFVEIVGHYNPRKNPAAVVLDTERVEYWMKRGAQPSETVRSFLKLQKKTQEPLPEQTA
jgi:small subunit ribosomal protein S16